MALMVTNTEDQYENQVGWATYRAHSQLGIVTAYVAKEPSQLDHQLTL